MSNQGFTAPDPGSVARTLTWLLGRDVQVLLGSTLETGGDARVPASMIVHEEGRPIGVLAADLALMAHMGAALALYPQARAEEMVETGVLDESLWENAQEVFNVLTRFYQPGVRGMIRLGDKWNGFNTPPQIRQVIEKSPIREDYRVKIPGYGEGMLSLAAFA